MIYCIWSIDLLFINLAEEKTLTKVWLAPMRDTICYKAGTKYNSENSNSIYRSPLTLETKEALMSLFKSTWIKRDKTDEY
jgi:hypothetical protein